MRATMIGHSWPAVLSRVSEETLVMAFESGTAASPPPRPKSSISVNPSTPFGACVKEVQRLHQSLLRLEGQAELLHLQPLAGREWYELLTRKLLPQLGDDPFNVVAVVGGTNIGKSVIFNHLAGSRASSTSPLASGTKHPVCLVPSGFGERHDLDEIFGGFELSEWTTSESALEQHDEHRLFWRESGDLPRNLLVLDTPDIDSDAEVNWVRADYVRHSADVLIAVLTQQKYNDAAVKQFFRKAAAEDKAVIVVFNQCLLPEDEEFWPLWLSTFTRETGIDPESVYVAPNDRKAAEQNQLPFRLRTWPRGTDATEKDESAPRDLRADLSQLHFAEIKFRTIRGSLRQLLHPQQGAPAYLDEIRGRSKDFQSAAELLTSQQLARIQNWPAMPNRLMVDEVRHWWRGQREGWTRSVHDAYNTLGEGVLWPFRWARSKINGPPPDPLEVYRKQERDVILLAIENLYEGLTQLQQLGNDLLRPRLTKLLAGAERAQLIARIGAAHDALQLDEELRSVVSHEMQTFRKDSPKLYEFVNRLDSLAAAARPVTSVVMFFAGGGPLGDAVTPVATEAAAQVVLHLAAGTGTVIAGDVALSRASEGLRTLEARFRQLQIAFTAHRVSWLANELRTQLLGSLQDELQTAAELPQSSDFLDVEACLKALSEQMSREPQHLAG